MSDLKAILDATKRIESILEQQCGGHGRGMHEKLSHVQVPLPEHLVKRVRYIASVRNKVVHEAGYDIADMPAFLDTCTRTADALEAVAASTPPGPHKAARGRSRAWRWWLLVCIAGLLWLQMPQLLRTLWPAPSRSLPSTAAPAAVPQTVAPRPTPPEPAPRATATSSPAPAASPAAPPQAAAERAATSVPVQLSGLALQYRTGSFNRQEAQITLTVHNTSSATLAHLQLHARLYLNGEPQPVLDTATHGRASTLFAYLGERGLRAGEKRRITLTAGHMDAEGWRTPDVLNATARRLDVALHSYTDGRNRSVQASGPYVSTGVVGTPRAVSAPAATASAGGLHLSEPRIRYVPGAFNRMEPQLHVTLRNDTAHTVAHAFLAARLYLDGASTPAIRTSGRPGDDSFFADLGETGLAAGQSRTVRLYTSHLSHRAWHAPDAINAQSRRLELALLRYTNGRGQTVTLHTDPDRATWP